MSSFNGTGTFQISGTGLPYIAGTTISDTVGNQLNTDLAAGLTNCLCKDGQQTATAVIPFAQGISVGGGGTVTVMNSGGFVPTDQSGAGLTITTVRASYTQIGTRVFVELNIGIPSNVSGSAATIGLGSLPNCAAATGVGGVWCVFNGGSSFLMSYMVAGTNKFAITDTANNPKTNANLSGNTIACQFNYSTV